MLDIKEIEQEIAELERAKNHSPSACMYLAALYSIRDHGSAGVQHEPIMYSQAAAPIPAPVVSAKLDIYGNSDFLRAVDGKESNEAWDVINELMDTLKVVNPRVYDDVMRKMRAL